MKKFNAALKNAIIGLIAMLIVVWAIMIFTSCLSEQFNPINIMGIIIGFLVGAYYLGKEITAKKPNNE